MGFEPLEGGRDSLVNRTNRTSDLRRSGVKAGVRALPDHRAPYIRGVLGHKSAGGCSTAIFLTLLYHSSLDATTKPDRADTEEKGKTEATPPFLPLYRQTGRGFGAGFVTGFGAYPAPPFWGRFRPIYPCGKAMRVPPRGCGLIGPASTATAIGIARAGWAPLPGSGGNRVGSVRLP